MILRVWALYSRPRFLLGTLLTFYAVEVISYLVSCAILIVHIRNNPLGKYNMALYYSPYITGYPPFSQPYRGYCTSA